MNLQTIYRLTKSRLTAIAPVFKYIGQYMAGRDNTSYKVPAIYIEMPKDLEIQFWPGKIKGAVGVIRIHVINNAVYKNHDSVAQEAAQDEHQAMVNAIDSLLTGWVAIEAGKALTQQLIPVAANMENYTGQQVYSVLSYQTELYDRHLQG